LVLIRCQAINEAIGYTGEPVNDKQASKAYVSLKAGLTLEFFRISLLEGRRVAGRSQDVNDRRDVRA
jgi:hypothetical protein